MVRNMAPALALLAVLALGGNAQATTTDDRPRIALVIGNSDYTDMPLANPVNDADLMSATLKSLGFETIDLRNATAREMRRGVRDFAETLEKVGENAVSLVYYAGHGMQVGGRNYLIPVDAVIEREADVEIEAFAADGILSAIEYSTTALNIVILDACRNNPFARSFRSANKGLARMDAPRGTLLAYATAPGDVAADGAGGNSPYTSALVSQMTRPGLSVEQLFKTVRVSVMQETGERQVPWESSSLTGEFFFGGQETPAAATAQGGTQSPDMAAWNAIQSVSDPLLIQEFVRQFPDSPLAPIATAKIAALQRQATQATRMLSAKQPRFQHDGTWQVAYTIIGPVTDWQENHPDLCQVGEVATAEAEIKEGVLKATLRSTRAGNGSLTGEVQPDGSFTGEARGWGWKNIEPSLSVRLKPEGGKLVGVADGGRGKCLATIAMTRR